MRARTELAVFVAGGMLAAAIIALYRAFSQAFREIDGEGVVDLVDVLERGLCGDPSCAACYPPPVVELHAEDLRAELDRFIGPKPLERVELDGPAAPAAEGGAT